MPFVRRFLHDLPRVVSDKLNSFMSIVPSKLGVQGNGGRLYTKTENVEILVLPL